MYTNNSYPIQHYKNKLGETRYMFSINLGLDHSTNKVTRTTRRGYKTFAEAEIDYKQLVV